VPQSEAVNASLPANGYIDFFGYSTAAGGWLFCGWISRPYRTDEVGEIDFLAQYEQSQDRGKAILTFYQRSDLDQRSVGIIAFLPASSRIQGGLQHVSFQIGAVKYKAQNSATTARLLDQDLVDRLRPLLLHHALANPNRSYLLSITARRGFTGQDTLSALAEPVLLEIDEATFCPPTGVLLRGWCLVGAGIVRSIRVRSGPLSGELKLDDAIRIDRPDVITAVGQSLGFTDARCGFIAYAEGAISPGDITYVEIELTNGEIGFKNFKLTKRSGLDAMRRILEGVDVRYAELDGAFDHVLGPAITALNRARLQSAPVPAQIDYGSIPDQPRCTLIIPLYGRVDFVEYQLALFSQHPGMREVEILYVLDDPGKRRELEFLAQSTFERFRVPFRLLLLPANLGFAPANNVGLRAAHGEFVCFLNSDIFPITPDWLEQLMQRLEEHERSRCRRRAIAVRRRLDPARWLLLPPDRRAGRLAIRRTSRQRAPPRRRQLAAALRCHHRRLHADASSACRRARWI
jgi:glycosyltransferase involved in cell wall biosynthesis